MFVAVDRQERYRDEEIPPTFSKKIEVRCPVASVAQCSEVGVEAWVVGIGGGVPGIGAPVGQRERADEVE